MKIRTRIRWWLDDHNSHNDYVRWERTVKQYRRIGCPHNLKEYNRIHDIFVKTTKKCNDWCNGFCAHYPQEILEECEKKSIEEMFEDFVNRLDYCSDRMSYGRWMGLCAYLYSMEMKLFREAITSQ